MKILVVEDEVKVGDYLSQGLTEAGFAVDLERDGFSGRQKTISDLFDVIILDVMLPEMSGWQILQLLRDEGNSTPVLMLTARDSIDDRVKGLELGADDYLVKPFAFTELLARIRSLLRRRTALDSETVLTVGDLQLDVLSRRVKRADRQIELTAKEFALLEFLIRHRGEVLTRAMIASQVWDINFSFDTNVIDVAIRRLRAKVDDEFEPKLIRTVRGMGYALDDPGNS